ncbi:hypothetical protein J6590_036209 [Homalodisca vitripennis]|nr:hypothetical protein J6590_036209 [Homalodisca vitripennis]
MAAMWAVSVTVTVSTAVPLSLMDGAATPRVAVKGCDLIVHNWAIAVTQSLLLLTRSHSLFCQICRFSQLGSSLTAVLEFSGYSPIITAPISEFIDSVIPGSIPATRIIVKQNFCIQSIGAAKSVDFVVLVVEKCRGEVDQWVGQGSAFLMVFTESFPRLFSGESSKVTRPLQRTWLSSGLDGLVQEPEGRRTTVYLTIHGNYSIWRIILFW